MIKLKKIWKDIDRQIDQLAKEEAECQSQYDAFERIQDLFYQIQDKYAKLPKSLRNNLYTSQQRIEKQRCVLIEAIQINLDQPDSKLIPTIMLAEDQMKNYAELLKALNNLPNVDNYAPYEKARKIGVKAGKKAARELAATIKLILDHTSEEISYSLLKQENEDQTTDQFVESLHQAVQSAQTQYESAHELNQQIKETLDDKQKEGTSHDRK